MKFCQWLWIRTEQVANLSACCPSSGLHSVAWARGDDRKMLDRIVWVLNDWSAVMASLLETIALCIRVWLTSTPELPEHSTPAAPARGSERYDNFVQTLGPGLQADPASLTR